MQEASAFVEVTYHYVPEPASLLMVAAGGMFAFRKRRS
jgi:hypothetical protein